MTPILVTTEQAFANYVTSASIDLGYTPETDLYIRAGIDNLDDLTPAIFCYAVTANEDIQFSGIYRMSVNVDVTEIAADTDRTNRGVLADQFDQKLLVENIESLLMNAKPDLFVYQVQVDKTENEKAGDAWTQRYSFEVVAGLK